jgi:hypothetical protein
MGSGGDLLFNHSVEYKGTGCWPRRKASLERLCRAAGVVQYCTHEIHFDERAGMFRRETHTSA